MRRRCRCAGDGCPCVDAFELERDHPIPDDVRVQGAWVTWREPDARDDPDPPVPDRGDPRLPPPPIPDPFDPEEYL